MSYYYHRGKQLQANSFEQIYINYDFSPHLISLTLQLRTTYEY